MLQNRSSLLLSAAVIVVALFASWLRRGEKIAALEAALAAKPRVEFRDRVVEKRVVVKGPVHVVRVEAADGTKTTTVDRAPETVSINKDRDFVRVETPICPAPYRTKTRYAGLIFGADGYAGSWVKGSRLAITFFDTWDLGGNLTRERNGATVVGGDVGFRF